VLECNKCGILDTDGAMLKRRERGHETLCASCRAKPQTKIKTAYGVCLAWQGNFDDLDNPIDSRGKYYRPGVRLCGNRDCVEPTHIQVNVKPSTTADIVERMRKDKKSNPEKITLFLNALQEAANYRKRKNG
jgi:hypothetical protein